MPFNVSKSPRDLTVNFMSSSRSACIYLLELCLLESIAELSDSVDFFSSTIYDGEVMIDVFYSFSFLGVSGVADYHLLASLENLLCLFYATLGFALLRDLGKSSGSNDVFLSG